MRCDAFVFEADWAAHRGRYLLMYSRIRNSNRVAEDTDALQAWLMVPPSRMAPRTGLGSGFVVRFAGPSATSSLSDLRTLEIPTTNACKSPMKP